MGAGAHTRWLLIASGWLSLHFQYDTGAQLRSTTGYTHGYSSENLLRNVSGSGWARTLTYDPLMRLYDAGAGGRTRFVYDGEDRIAEYSSNGSQVARFVHGRERRRPRRGYRASAFGRAARGGRRSGSRRRCR